MKKKTQEEPEENFIGRNFTLKRYPVTDGIDPETGEPMKVHQYRFHNGQEKKIFQYRLVNGDWSEKYSKECLYTQEDAEATLVILQQESHPDFMFEVRRRQTKKILAHGIIRQVYKLPIYPSKGQKEHLRKCFGIVRMFWNYEVGKARHYYNQSRWHFNRYNESKKIPIFKKEELGNVLSIPPAQALIETLLNLDKANTAAYARIAKGEKPGFPKFKSKDYGGSFSTSQGFKLDLTRRKVFIPKIGWIKATIDRKYLDRLNDRNGKIMTGTVKETPSGKFRAVIMMEESGIYPVTPEFKPETLIGINLGITRYATLHTGETIDNPKFILEYEKKLQYAHYVLSRRKPGSERWHQQRRNLATIYERLVNLRDHFQHELSNDLLRRFDALIVGTWDIKGMMKVLTKEEKEELEKKRAARAKVPKKKQNLKRSVQRNLNKLMADASPYEMARKLMYKAERRGKIVFRGEKNAKETKTCSHCGHVNDWVTAAHRVWDCEVCNYHHDIDQNAAINQRQWQLEK